ncbi:MAG: RluA family pseudouridine synthase [Verrucomicrobia bacterium]|nr:RluA family pseudouridine synthase [Verrucomicrobiota bacterium]
MTLPEQNSEFDLEIGPDNHRQRADKAVTALMHGFSRSRIQKLFDLGLIWRDDEALCKSDTVRIGDEIKVSVPPTRPLQLRPVAIPLQVLFEDEHLLAINKASGMVTHPGVATGEDTLVHALLHHCSGKLSGIGGIERPGIVHRLDKETSGVIVVAKSDIAHKGLSLSFANRSLEKYYVALVRGCPQPSHGSIDAAIGRHPIHRQRMAVVPNGRHALTDFSLLQQLPEDLSLLQLRIHTGRTHQIRVHLSSIGHPVAGDLLYGWRNSYSHRVFSRVMLHAHVLRITHPVNQQPLEFIAPIPPDFS